VLVLIPLILGIVIGLAAGGKIGKLAEVRFHWPWFVLVVLLVREAVLLNPLNRIEGIQYVYATAQAGLVGWTAWNIRRLPGVWVVTLGAAMNLAVILANNARMPVTSSMAGVLVQRGHLAQYTLMGPDTNLNWLGDWIVSQWPVPGAYSPGDLVLALGIGIVVIVATVHHPAAGTKLG
jgi:hypothetical protein